MPKKPKKKDISILDVTIRDGSYAINYQYTPGQVQGIVRALDQAGIDCIEVSHGCGLGAAQNLKLPSAATDAEYVRAAKGAATRARIGVIAGGPPVTHPKDIDTVIDEVDFIRFAANCDTPRGVEGNIEYAQKLRPRLPLFLQLMRSTRRPKKDLVAAGRCAEDMGIDTVYVVDTAGHFLPEEVEDVIAALVAKLSIDVGFHGHNNLGLANANSLAAIDAGARSIDASLKGMGRSAGNAQLESLISLLKRRGLARGIDLDLLIDAGQSLITPIMPPQFGVDAIDLMTADANIDLPASPDLFEQIALAAQVELRTLIRALGRDARVMEVGPVDLVRALKKLGANAPRAFQQAGLQFPIGAQKRAARR